MRTAVAAVTHRPHPDPFPAPPLPPLASPAATSEPAAAAPAALTSEAAAAAPASTAEAAAAAPTPTRPAPLTPLLPLGATSARSRKEPPPLAHLHPPLHPYEQQRLSRCMQNSGRLQQLGIPTIRTMFEDAAAISRDKKKKHGNREDSGSEYDPVQDDNSEDDCIEDGSEKGSNGKTRKKTNKQTPTTVVKFQTRKRVYAAALPNQGPSSKRTNSVLDASRTPSAIQVPPPSHTIVTPVVEPVGNFEDNPQEDGDDDIARSDGHNHLSSEEGGGNNIGRSDGHNHLSSEAVGDVGYNDDNTMVDGPDAITLPAGDNQMINEESVEAELEVQRMANADLQSKMDDMSKKMQETEDARRRDQEELKEMKKKQAELEAALHRILTQN
nr:unnamed protein product [Digitaria exilis]